MGVIASIWGWLWKGALVYTVAPSIIVAPFYERGHQQPDSALYTSPIANPVAAKLAVVTVDDHGWFTQPTQAHVALQAVRSALDSGPTAVVVFVHGWAHHARGDDQNLVCFAKTLDHLQSGLPTRIERATSATRQAIKREIVQAEQSKYSALARQLALPDTNSPVRVIGIYVGWRGRGVPEMEILGPSSVLDRVPTYWSRKAGAVRVGTGDLAMFLNELAAMYDTNHAGFRYGRATNPLFLVAAGHSFGGQVLLPSVAPRLEEGFRRVAGERMWETQNATASATPVQVAGFGDLVILVNPALEAEWFERLRLAEQSLKYSSEQTPILAVFSAENDVARSALFPVAQNLSHAVEPIYSHETKPGQLGRELTALGMDRQQLTHRLFIATDTLPLKGRLSARKDSDPNNPYTHVSDIAGDCDYGVGYYTAKSRGAIEDLSGSFRLAGVQAALADDTGAVPHRPLIVAETTKEIIDGHNGFFNARFIDFLAEYVEQIEARKADQLYQARLEVLRAMQKQ